MTLFELTKEFEKLEEKMLLSINEETGEIENSELIEEIEKELKDMLANKSENIIRYIRAKELSIKATDEEIERLKKYKKSSEKRLDNFKKYVLMNMYKMGKTDLETNIGKISISKSVKTIINEDIIKKDPRYYRAETKIEHKFDKTAIRKLINSGVNIEGAYLEENSSIKIK